GTGAHETVIGTIRLAAIGKGAEAGAAPSADRSIFARTELRLRRTIATTAALARIQNSVALRPRQAGIGEGLSVAAALAAYRGVFEGARGGPVVPGRRWTRPLLDDSAAGHEHERQAGQQDGTGTR